MGNPDRISLKGPLELWSFPLINTIVAVSTARGKLNASNVGDNVDNISNSSNKIQYRPEPVDRGRKEVDESDSTSSNDTAKFLEDINLESIPQANSEEQSSQITEETTTNGESEDNVDGVQVDKQTLGEVVNKVASEELSDDAEKTDTTDNTRDEDDTVVVYEDKEDLLFFENRNVTKNMPFDPQNPERDEGFPIKGRGRIDNIVIQAQSDTFNIFMKVDDDEVINNENFSYLQSLSDQLSNIDAYQKNSGEYVISIVDYPFREQVKFGITPTSETTFDLIRTEAIIESR